MSPKIWAIRPATCLYSYVLLFIWTFVNLPPGFWCFVPIFLCSSLHLNARPIEPFLSAQASRAYILMFFSSFEPYVLTGNVRDTNLVPIFLCSSLHLNIQNGTGKSDRGRIVPIFLCSSLHLNTLFTFSNMVSSVSCLYSYVLLFIWTCFRPLPLSWQFWCLYSYVLLFIWTV